MNPNAEILVDGNLSEWEYVPWTDDFIDITGNSNLKPGLKTRARLLWDDQFLYVAAEMQEPHLWATITNRDEVIYVDNDFEIFIDPDGDTHNYAEIEVNAFGTVWDLFLTRPYRDGTTPLNSYNIGGLLCEVQLHGTINNPSDVDSCWTLEMAIPWSALVDMTPGKRKPYPGEYWRINFSRVHWELDAEKGAYVKKDVPENNWVWSPQWEINMHMPEKWGYVFFSDKEATLALDQPTVPEEEQIREALRTIYYIQKENRSIYGTYSGELIFLDPESKATAKLPAGGTISLSSSDDQFLFEYSESNGTKWYIDQHGKIWNKPLINAWIWMHGDNKLSDEEWKERFHTLHANGIDGVLLGGSNDLLERIIPIASKEEIYIQAWRWMLNCNDKEIIDKHPDWYSVSREGYSCLEKQPYVAYYKWLCPSNPGVREYLNTKVSETMSLEGLAGFHMDYIRHPDVILPIALWETYGLVQDHEMPEYDYCYCDLCRSNFKNKYAYDPLDLAHPDLDSNWRQFRYDIISEFVNGLSDEFPSNYVFPNNLSAAVFPTPEIARNLVRQDWNKWNSLSQVFPMIYHSFYNEDLAWIGEATWAGVHALEKKAQLFTGLYIPALTPEELNLAIKIAINAGASGISLFDYNAMTEAHWEVVRKRMNAHK